MKARGYDMNRAAQAVAQLFQMKQAKIFTKGRREQKVMARSLFCFWAVRDLGLLIKTLAATIEMTGPGVGYAVERG
jgi:hypothetical protein